MDTNAREIVNEPTSRPLPWHDHFRANVHCNSLSAEHDNWYTCVCTYKKTHIVSFFFLVRCVLNIRQTNARKKNSLAMIRNHKQEWVPKRVSERWWKMEKTQGGISTMKSDKFHSFTYFALISAIKWKLEVKYRNLYSRAHLTVVEFCASFGTFSCRYILYVPSISASFCWFGCVCFCVADIFTPFLWTFRLFSNLQWYNIPFSTSLLNVFPVNISFFGSCLYSADETTFECRMCCV